MRNIDKYFEQFILVLSEFLRLENRCSPLIQLVLLLYSKLYCISFVYQYSQFNILNEFEDASLVILVRPYLFIDINYQLLILISIVLFIQHIIIGIALKLALSKNVSNIIHTLEFDDRLKLIVTLYFYTISTSLYGPLIELAILNLNNGIYGLIASTILIVETMSIIIIGDQIYRSGIVLHDKTIFFLNKTLINYLIKLLQLIQIILYFYLQDQYTSFMIQSIILFITQISTIYMIMENKIYLSKLQVFSDMLLTSISLFISLFATLRQSIRYDELWLLLSILLSKILYECYQHPIIQIHKQPIHILKYLFSQFSHFDINNQQHQLRLILMLQAYIRDSKDQTDIQQTPPLPLRASRMTILSSKLLMHQISQQQSSRRSIRKRQVKYQLVSVNKDALINKQNLIKVILDNMKKLSDKYRIVSLDYITVLIRNGQLVQSEKELYKLYIKGSNKKEYKPSSLMGQYLQHYVQELIIIQMRIKRYFANQSISYQFRQFALNEIQNIETQEQFRQMVQLKYKLFVNLNNETKVKANFSQIQKYYKIVQKLQLFKQRLHQQYINYPTISNQNMLKYYCVEMLNDFIEAFNLHQNTALDDEKYLKYNDSAYNKLFGLTPSYMVVQLDSELHISIVRISKWAGQFMSKLAGNKNLLKTDEPIPIQQFYPNYVRQVHHKLCEQFFDKGLNKFYQVQLLSFVQSYSENLIMIPIEMMMGLNHSSFDRIQLYAFFYQSEDNRIIIVVNEQFEIVNCTESLNKHLIRILNSPNFTQSKLYIQTIIPEFLVYVQQTFIDNGRIRLMNENVRINRWEEYSSFIYIQKKFNQWEPCYFIVLENLKKVLYNTSSEIEYSFTSFKDPSIIHTIKLQQDYEDEYGEAIFKNIPYEDIKATPNLSLNQLDSQQILNNNTTEIMRTIQFQQLKANTSFRLFQENRNINQIRGDTESHKRYYYEDNSLTNQKLLANNVDTQSQVSSVTAIKRSKFYKKFETIHILTKSTKSSSKILQINLIFILFLLCAIINSIIILVSVTNMTNLIQDIKLLAIRCDVTEPLDSFIITRYTVVNYNQQYRQKKINESQLEYLTAFPKSNLANAYDILKERLYSVLQRPEIDAITKDKQITVKFYQSTNNGIEDQITFRTLASLLMNYQYEYKLALTVKTIQLDSPYFYFSFKNYLTIKQTFIDLNQEILDQSLWRIQEESDNWLAKFIPFLLLICLFYILIYYINYRFNSEQFMFSNYIFRLDPLIIEQEKARIQFIIAQLSDFETLKFFQLDTEQLDKQLDKLQLKGVKMNRKEIEESKISVHQYSNIVIQTINLFLYLGFATVIYLLMDVYFEKYQNTAIFYFKLSNLNSDVPTAYSQREVLYRRDALYTEQDLEQLLDLFVQTVNDIDAYLKEYSKLVDSMYLFDSSTMDIFYKAYNEDLCQQLSSDFEVKGQEICYQVMDGNLRLGLRQNLIEIVNSLRIEQMETNNFTIQRLAYLELEGATLITNVLTNLKQKMFDNLITITKELIIQQQIICISFLILELILLYMYFRVINRQNYQKYQNLKKLIYLFPRYSLMFDDQFYREIRSYIRQEDL